MPLLHAPGDEKNLILLPLHDVAGGVLQITFAHRLDVVVPFEEVELPEPEPVEVFCVAGAVSCPAQLGSHAAHCSPLHDCWHVDVKPSAHVFEFVPQALDSHGLH